jgi:cyclase
MNHVQHSKVKFRDAPRNRELRTKLLLGVAHVMGKTSVIRSVIVATLLGGLWLAYTQQGPLASKLTTQKIANDLYVIHNDFVPGNTTVLVTNEGVILVDDKFPVDHQNIMAELKKITDQPVKYVVNTHHHGDHSGGNEEMRKIGAQLISSEQARRYMVDANQPGLTNLTFQDHMHLYLGGKHIEMYYFGRSHTGGDIVIYFPAERAISMGDMFTVGDSTPQLVDYTNGGSAREWTGTVNRALQLDFDTVVPGHGNVSTRADLIRFRDSTVTLRNKIHEMIVAKNSRADVEKMLRSDFRWGDLPINGSLDGLMVELR